MKFIDLFAGLGGFHLALSGLGHECVFASEINPALQSLYEKNFGISPSGDMRNIEIQDIPKHDLLCAGFPCQPFSKAGEQQGFNCSKRGDLFDFVIKAIEFHRPKYFILENVPNITRHDQGRTWDSILNELRKEALGYEVDFHYLSPHDFGIPQIRQRIFIVGSQSGLEHFTWPMPNNKTPSLGKILSRNGEGFRKLSPHYTKCIDVWQEFLDSFPKDIGLPSFPIWSMEFGATYPYQDSTPYSLVEDGRKRRRLINAKGTHGIPLMGLSREEIWANLPSYAKTKEQKFPSWKIRFIRQNRELYESLRPWIDEWIPKIIEFPASLQKLEWNYKGGERNIWKHVLQLRASGIRVKRATTAPSLVAMTTTQIPIVGNSRETKRYMTMRECARLQSMHKLKYLPETENQAFKALGNAVNVEVVRMVAQALIKPEKSLNDNSITNGNYPRLN
ncbi:MAG: DNA (cytosine-5-)-methyltransferase, partial [Bacteroidota bacterium]